MESSERLLRLAHRELFPVSPNLNSEEGGRASSNGEVGWPTWVKSARDKSEN